MTAVDGESAVYPGEPESVAELDESSEFEMEGSEPGFRSRKRRFARWLSRALVAFPKATIEAVLFVAALVVGLVVLPSLAVLSSSQPAIQAIILERPYDIPSYLLFDNFGSGNTIALGMDVPAGVTAHWTLVIILNSEDSLTNESFSPDIKYTGSASSSALADPGFRGVVLTGTFAAGAKSYTEFDSGYYQVYSERYRAFGESGNHGLPKDYEAVNFSVSGPVHLATVSGANVSVSLPSLVQRDKFTATGQTSAPFNSEVFYDGGIYQPLTGGATIQGGRYWDWFTHGFFPPAVATGLDAVEQENEQTKTFVAAAMFGLAASALAGMCIEIVDAAGAVRRRRKPKN